LKKKAYVLINVSAGKLDSVMRKLSSMPNVISVEGVSGHCDVVAVIADSDLESLQDTVLSTVRGVDGIVSTETWIVMVPQPDTWTSEELKRYVSDCSVNELAAIRIIHEKRRGVMIQELVENMAERLDDESYDVHGLTITLTDMTRRAQREYRRESIIEFDQDMGYFLNERYIDMLEAILTENP